MQPYVISAYHEAGHIVIGALLGKRVKQATIAPQSGSTDFFGPDEALDPPPPVLGTVERLPGLEQPNVYMDEASRRRTRLEAYRDFSLQESLLSLVAGVETARFYEAQQGIPVSDAINLGEIDSSAIDDQQTICTILEDARQLDHYTMLCQQAQVCVRTLLHIPRIWSITEQFADYLLKNTSFAWFPLQLFSNTFPMSTTPDGNGEKARNDLKDAIEELLKQRAIYLREAGTPCFHVVGGINGRFPN